MTKEYSIDQLIAYAQADVRLRETLLEDMFCDSGMGPITEGDLEELNLSVAIVEHLIRSRNENLNAL